ncbi:hypothetical protein ACQ4M3_38975 [Leptolyngbya sp. AN03gr2]|uniref:hypothetical protein n=1 Tax=unclassified Leptolyngbya TaxID=2650499 RepID=UPI003D311996
MTHVPGSPTFKIVVVATSIERYRLHSFIESGSIETGVVARLDRDHNGFTRDAESVRCITLEPDLILAVNELAFGVTVS